MGPLQKPFRSHFQKNVYLIAFDENSAAPLLNKIAHFFGFFSQL